MTYTFVKSSDNILTLDGREIGVRAQYGISSDDFLYYQQKLKGSFNFELKQIEFKVNYYVQDGPPKVGTTRPIREVMDFIIYTNILEEKGIDITNLLSQIIPGKDYHEVLHASSLAVLAYIYEKNGYTITFLPKKGPDFQINEIIADIKVLQPSLLQEPRGFKVKNGRVDIQNTILLDFSKRLSSRFNEGVKQADLLFFNMTSSPFSGLLDFMYTGNDNVIEPKSNRVIYYNSSPIIPNVERGFRTPDGKDFPLEPRYFPDLHSFARAR